MDLIRRVQDILLRPKETWPVIAKEQTGAASLHKGYLIFLAAVPAVAGFIGLSLIGMGAMGVNVCIPIVSGLTSMVVGYVLSLALVLALGLI